MENQDFSTTVVVKQSPAEVFKTLLNVRAWWSGLYDESFEGSSDQVGDEFSFRAGGGAHYSKQKLVELVPGKQVKWLVTEANLNFVDNTDEWKGTTIEFDLAEKDDGTEITFTHHGLVPQFECYDDCAPAWQLYVHQQLVNALQ